MKNLVIVESPAKAKTIEKFLGADYRVLSSYGHIRDLKKKGISIDFENDFRPEYEIPAEKKELVRQLTKAAKEAETVWLASDEDREGEAIAWHLYEVLGLKPENTRRIVFHEITKPAILHAIANPRGIDIDRVNAQQARRVLDRIVGFELSPVLWKKIKPALSAGRVQSVAVRLICEREKEIAGFLSEPYFRVSATFETGAGEIKAELTRRMPDEHSAHRFLEECRKADFKVGSVTVHPMKRSPMPPFTTSTLQQEAGKRLGFSVKRTMSVAQRLYEAGKITYMRTDSLNLSELALADIAKAVESSYGKQYLHQRRYHTGAKGAQEAHEAIRPTYVSNRTIEGEPDERRLYELIWSRAVASQMADAELEKTSVEINVTPSAKSDALSLAPPTDDANPLGVFKAEGSVVKFPGFMEAYAHEGGELPAKETILPPLAEGQLLEEREITATQRFSQAPPRFTEAALVKKMEELGIGRPSTYAPTISTIQERDYIKRGDREGTPREYLQLTLRNGTVTDHLMTENTGSDKGKLVPTDVGMIVNDFLIQYFPDILDYNFTARIEGKFDEIAEGKLGWQAELGDFYGGFHPDIEKINSMQLEHKVGERLLGTDPKSGRPVFVKIGRFGPMAQIGEASDEEKPQFAGLEPTQSIQTITLEEALRLFDLPRTVGEYDGKTVTAAVGRFGPYLKFGSLFVSIPKELTPQGITIDEAILLIEKKLEAEANKFIRDFTEIPGLQALNGRWGPYLAYKPEGARKAVNYKLPKGTDVAAMTADDARKLMEAQDAAPKKKVAARKKK